MEGPYLPGESEGEESSAEPLSPEDRAAEVYNARMRLFELAHEPASLGRRRRLRRAYRDYTVKNCEEAWGGRGSGP